MKALLIAVIALSTAAAQEPQRLNFEQWNAKPGEEQLKYLVQCVDAIATDVAKRNKDVAQKIRDYYSYKAPGQKFSEGTAKLLDTLGILIRLKKTNPLVNFSSVDVCTLVYQPIIDKFEPPKKPQP